MDSSPKVEMEPEACQVAAVCQVPTGSTRPAGANTGKSVCQPNPEDRKRGKAKKGKTKMDTTKDGKRGPRPEAKMDYMVYLDADPLKDQEAALAYHEDFLRKVFGSTTEVTVAFSFSTALNAFVAWLTEEEAQILLGREEVTDIVYTPPKKSRRQMKKKKIDLAEEEEIDLLAAEEELDFIRSCNLR